MQDDVEAVKQKTDIVTLIAEHVNLTKAGKHYKGLCPFHSEKSPSFIVSPEMQIYKCFGCGESGDVFTFLEKYDGMEFGEALRYLAQKAGITLSGKLRDTNFSQKETLIKLNELAADFYHYVLASHQGGKRALEYVMAKRGINRELIDLFKIGYAPDVPGALFSFLTKRKYKPEDIEKAGLVVNISKTSAKRYLDRFRGRIIFPLQDPRGSVIALAGRILPGSKNEDRLAKYINSPQTPIYNKSATLYGLHITKQYIKQEKKAVIVEGEVDLISSFGGGVKNVVAIKGTALTEDQVRILSRLTSEIVIALDSDLAGDAAARRGIHIAQAAGLTIKVMHQKKYKDPDEFVRSDPKGYKKALDEAIGVWDFIIDSIVEKFDTSTGEGKAKVSREAVPLIASIEDNIVQSYYASLLARKLGVEAEAVQKQIEKITTKKPMDFVPTSQKEVKVSSREEKLEDEVLSWAFTSDPALLLKSEYENLLASPFSQKLLRFLKTFLESGSYSSSAFSKALPPELKEKFTEIVLRVETEEVPHTRKLELLKSAARELEVIRVKERLSELARSLSSSESEGNSDEVEKIQQEFALLTKKLTQFRS